MNVDIRRHGRIEETAVAGPGCVAARPDDDDRAAVLSAVGALVADPARCSMLTALLSGQEMRASMLAAEARVRPATASSHLNKLTEAGFVRVRSQGRFRYYQLANAEVAELIEMMERLAPLRPIRSLAESNRVRALRIARSNYDHLAGRVAVDVMDALLRLGHIEGADALVTTKTTHHEPLSLTDDGAHHLASFGLTITDADYTFVSHVDALEARPHIAGSLGMRLLDEFLRLNWFRRVANSRVLVPTETGRTALLAICTADDSACDLAATY
jgi:DNA-binding transcriptional ArsR family regulator